METQMIRQPLAYFFLMLILVMVMIKYLEVKFGILWGSIVKYNIPRKNFEDGDALMC